MFVAINLKKGKEIRLFRWSAPGLLAPGVTDQEKQDPEADDQKHNWPGLFFPQLLKSSRYFVHATRIFTVPRLLSWGKDIPRKTIKGAPCSQGTMP